MKFGALLDEQTAVALGLEWLAHEVAPRSAYGRRSFAAFQPYVHAQSGAAAERARDICAFASTYDEARVAALREIIGGVPDVRNCLASASAGDVLTDVDFLELQRFCDALARIDTLLSKQALFPRIPCCDDVARVLEPGRTPASGFYLDDRFSPVLGAARKNLAMKQADFEATRGPRERETDEFIIMREDVQGPLPRGVRVIREAPTYFLCQAELGEDALRALTACDLAAADLASAEERVRRDVSAVVASHVRSLMSAAQSLGSLDIFVAAVGYTQRYGCVAAQESEHALEFDDGCFLPVQAQLRARNLPYTPTSIVLSREAVLTGPNMGGKSLALRTCGFIAVCAAFGLPVPAKRARVPLLAQIAWLGSSTEGDQESKLLSSFAGEVVRVRDAMQARAEPALWLIDEFARTTAPAESRALLLAIIAEVRRRGAYAFITTHLRGIAGTAGVAHYAVRGLRSVPAPAADVGEALAALAHSMDYRIELHSGQDDSSAQALIVAGVLGLDQRLLTHAWQLLGNGESDLD